MARFLIVDDDAAIVAALAKLLRSDGHLVLSFTAGADAVRVLARELVDVVIADLEMPDVDGRALVHGARARLPYACLVVTTGEAREVSEELADAGVCIVLDKVLDYADVAAAVTDCRARGGPGAHAACPVRKPRACIS
jgi:CheY-like chemotaxis protein